MGKDTKIIELQCVVTDILSKIQFWGVGYRYGPQKIIGGSENLNPIIFWQSGPY